MCPAPSDQGADGHVGSQRPSQEEWERRLRVSEWEKKHLLPSASLAPNLRNPFLQTEWRKKGSLVSRPSFIPLDQVPAPSPAMWPPGLALEAVSAPGQC